MMKERIKALRNSLGLTQQAFGQNIGVKRNTIATYETQDKVPMDTVINNICSTYGVNEEWLRTGKGDMFNEVDDKLATYMSEITDGNDDFIKTFIEIYMELDQKSKDVLKDMGTKMAKRLIKKEQI